MMRSRRAISVMSSSSRGTSSYAWMEEISNGTLVHYIAAEPWTPPQGAALLRHGPPADDVMDDIRQAQQEEARGDAFVITEKTVYCADREQVKGAIMMAMDAHDKIEEFKRWRSPPSTRRNSFRARTKT